MRPKHGGILALACLGTWLVSGRALADESADASVVDEVLGILKERGIVDESEYARLATRNASYEAKQEEGFLSRIDWSGDLRLRYESFWFDDDKVEDKDNRFRVNLFMARGTISVAARLITSNILPFEGLHLPAIMSDISMQPQGLVLLCGVTGSGKSTTIASMLDYVNERKKVHILTIEDPIEYIFEDKKATINQREIGIDCLDFKIALRALVRENPDIVLVGEMRDQETFEAALHAAETGHLVFGTIHASSTTQTFSRIYGLFEQEEVEQVRRILGYQMRAFVYQKLLPTLHEKIHRIPAVEILINNGVVRKMVLEGREGELREYLKSIEARQTGMIDFNQALVDLVEAEMIHLRVAMEATPNADELQMRLKKLA